MDWIGKYQFLFDLLSKDTYYGLLEVAESEDPRLRQDVLNVLERLGRVGHTYVETKKVQHYQKFIDNLDEFVKTENLKIKMRLK